MSYPTQRNKNGELVNGATDGKYQRVRMNTTVGPDNGLGDHLTISDRHGLNPLNGYQDMESPVKVVPNSFSNAHMF